ncbi:MAG TPA: sugar ABC transporter permease [Chloroflexota bacterium]|nr:sugar ABC transporter permease [Chloroflexota bacterium]
MVTRNTSVASDAGTRVSVAGRRTSRSIPGTRLAPWVFISPFFILLFAFTIGPMLYSLWMSLQSDRTGAFVGLGNYSTVLQDTDFRAAGGVIWQAVYTLAPFFCIVAAVIAFIVDGNAGWGKGLAKLLMFLPFAMPATASTILWAFNYSPDSSVFSPVLHWMGVTNVLWFGTPTTLPYAIMNIVVWQNIGAWVVVLTASLAGLPSEIIEMARIEGAGWLSLTLRIKLPLIAPVLILMVISVVGYVLTLITEPYLLQQALQVPATYTPNMWAYNISFQSSAFNLAAAAAILLLLVSSVFAITLVLRSGVYRLQDR